jgi:hypothetical protein
MGNEHRISICKDERKGLFGRSVSGWEISVMKLGSCG